jgi:hypothetical protein
MTSNSMPGAGVEPALPCGKGILRTTHQRSGTEREGAAQSERAPGQGARGSATERTPAPDPAPCAPDLGARRAWQTATLSAVDEIVHRAAGATPDEVAWLRTQLLDAYDRENNARCAANLWEAIGASPARLTGGAS